jgi:hypothetical protein
MQTCQQSFVYVVWLVALGLASGCSEGPPLYSVKGQVVHRSDGSPFNTTSIVFESTKPPYSRAYGELDEQGRFELSTENRGGYGAMEGPHRVQISYVDTNGVDLRPQLSKLIDPKYFEFRTSGIEVDIKPDQPNEFKIELERAK